MVSLVNGVTLLVLVSMVTLDLVCGSQERGEDSQLKYSLQKHYTLHTEELNGMALYVQKTLRKIILNLKNNDVIKAEVGELNPEHEPVPKHSTADHQLSNHLVMDSGLLHKTDEGMKSSEDPVVLTHSGPVHGLRLDKTYAFYGIPYAAPPVGSKRWAAPEPVSPWTNLYDATFFRPACMQACAREFSEICPSEVTVILSKCLLSDMAGSIFEF